MLFLLFQIGKDRYGLEASQITEVVPLVRLKRIPRAFPGIAGIFNYHGILVPVIDLSELALGCASETCLSTRIIVVNYQAHTKKGHVLGLMAERATEAIQLDPKTFSDLNVEVPDAPYLGPVARDAHGLIQWIEIKKLMPDALRDRLFQEIGEYV
jgi:chemotaxis-related protein WspB